MENGKTAIEDIYPLSPMQEGILFHSLNRQGTSNYLEQVTYRIRGNLQIELVEKSFNELFKRHDILRTAFVYEAASQPMQVVLKNRKVEFQYHDIRSYSSATEKETFVQDFLLHDKNRYFDLSKDALMRVGIIQTNENEYEFVWTHHHILMDGWCIGILNREYHEIYSSFVQLRNYILPSVKQYKYYIQWLLQQDKVLSRKYWSGYLSGYAQLNSIPRKNNETGDGSSYDASEVTFDLDEDSTQKLMAIAAANNITLNSLIEAVWGILLSKYNNTTDVVYGAVKSGRAAGPEGIESMTGLFINTVPVRIQYDAHTTFTGLIKKVQKNALEGMPYHYALLSDIQSESELKQDLLDHILAFENYPLDREIASPTVFGEKQEAALEISNFSAFTQSNYNFNVVVFPGKELCISLRFNRNVYDELFIAKIPGHFKKLVGNIIDNPGREIVKLRIITQEEQHQLLNSFNNTRVWFDEKMTIVDLFEEQVLLHPHKIAVEWDEKELTYHRLNEQANKLAFHIQKSYGVDRGDLIGILMNRSDQLVAGILAILKCGAGYVPIDVSNAPERIDFIIKDAGIKLLLCSSTEKAHIPTACEGIEICYIDTLTDDLIDSDFRSLESVSSGDIAYVIYTSGSTGRPKGCMIEHRSVINLVNWHKRVYGLDNSRATLFSNIGFDASVWELWPYLLSGCTVFPLKESVKRDVDSLVNFLNEHSITHCFLPTRICEEVMAHSGYNKNICLLTGGEKLIRYPAKHLNVVNNYGPTENTVVSTYSFLKEHNDDNRIPIGKPIDNTTVYILDQFLNMQPVGVEGEICIGGIGLAKGYINQEQLTAEKFISSPFNAGERLYKTGDKGRWLATGDIEYTGRLDDQVKLRGYRIEPGEIEGAFIRFPGIEQVVVTAWGEDGNKYLAAYYISREIIDEAELKIFLRKHLPAYMIPAYILRINGIPKTISGKLDKTKLPNPVIAGAGKGHAYVAPESDIEIRLVQIWQGLLDQRLIGINDIFFEIGGDSIKAIRVIAAIYKSLGVKLNVTDIYDKQTIYELARFIKGKKHDETADKELADILEHLEKIKKEFKENESLSQRYPSLVDVFPMSDIQKGMLYYTFFQEARGVYHEQVYQQIKDDTFDLGKLKAAFLLLVQKHAILRTSFLFHEKLELQLVHNTASVEQLIRLEDISGLDTRIQKTYMNEYLIKDRLHPFNMHEPGLWRVTVFRLSQNEYGLLLIFHHAIIDGWSEASLLTELSHIYFSLKKDLPVSVDPLKVSYKDYVIKLLRNKTASENFWINYLNQHKHTGIPFGKTVKPVVSPETDTWSFSASRQVNELMNGKFEHIYPGKVFFAAFCQLIRFTANAEDITIGLATNGRPDTQDGDRVIGCFINTIPFRVNKAFGKNNELYLEDIGSLLKELKQHDRVSLFEIAKLIGRQVGGSNPVFDILFNYVDFHVYNNIHNEVQETDSFISGHSTNNIFFNFAVARSGNGFVMQMTTPAGTYSKEEFELLGSYYNQILYHLLFNRSASISITDIIDAEDKRRLLVQYNGTSSVYPSEKTITELFEEQVRNTPQNIALGYKEIMLSYAELNARSNQLANYLHGNLQVTPQTVIGIMLDRSDWLVVSILAILKAGCIYLPIDPAYPENRVKFMIEDTAVQVIISSKKHRKNLEIMNGLTVLEVDGEQESVITGMGSYWQSYPAEPADLAYIMYTSGSTGEPKGVMVTHNNVVSLVKNGGYITFEDHHVLLSTGSPSFDATTFEYWGMLLNGGKLVLTTEETLLDTILLKEEINRHHVTYMWFTASLFNQLVDSDIDVFANLQTIVAGGEKLSALHIKKLRQTYPLITIINGYGPTENTSFSLTYKIPGPDVPDSVPIGKPLNNRIAYVLNEQKQLCPIGVVGELYVGGAGLAAGYWNRAELTAEKFIENPFASIGNTRLYKTGDLVRMCPGGIIEYIGRIDNQIKLRGYRIELSEIEYVMQRFQGVETAVAIVNEQGVQKQIIAYFISAKDVDEAALRMYLSKNLPAYMVPVSLVRVESFVLTANGKLDRSKLPEPATVSVNLKSTDLPNDPLHEVMIKIWEDVLGRTPITIHDNFFAIGGDSIKAIQIAARLFKAGIKLEIKDLFLYQAISELSDKLKPVRAEVQSNQSPVTGDVPLTPIQHYFFNSAHDRPGHYNQSVLLHFDKGLEVEAIRAVFSFLQEHHDALRMTFKTDQGNVYQYNHGTGYPLQLDVYELTELADPEKELATISGNIQAGIDLAAGPLMRLGLFKTNAGDKLLIVIHHLVIDGISWRILLEDLTVLYHQFQNGQQLSVGAKSDSFKSWAEQLKCFANSQRCIEQIVYWKELEKREWKKIRQVQSETLFVKNSKTLSVELPEDQTALLLTTANNTFNTQVNDLLLTALALTIREVFNNREVLLNLEGHGRESIIDDINVHRTVGWFTSIYPVLFELENEYDFSRNIKMVKEYMRKVPDRGIGYGVLKYLTGEDYKQGLLFNINPEISFNYLGQIDHDLNKSSLQVSPEYQGANHGELIKRLSPVEVVCIVSGNRLNTSCIYDVHLFNDAEMQVFLMRFMDMLAEIIHHCCASSREERTPDDFIYKDLSLEELDNFFD